MSEREAFIKSVNEEDFNRLYKAVNEGNSAKVLGLIALYTKIGLFKVQTDAAKTALRLTAYHSYPSDLKVLVEADADIGKEDILLEGSAVYGALHSALRNDHARAIQHLVPLYAQAGSLNKGAKDYKTALIRAAKKGNDVCVRLLIEAGADIAKTDSNSFNALHWAVSKDKSSIVTYLVPLFAQKRLLDVQARGGETALTIAACNAHDTQVKLLMDGGADILVKRIT